MQQDSTGTNLGLFSEGWVQYSVRMCTVYLWTPEYRQYCKHMHGANWYLNVKWLYLSGQCNRQQSDLKAQSPLSSNYVDPVSVREKPKPVNCVGRLMSRDRTRKVI